MKTLTFLSFVLLVSIVFFAFGVMVEDLETNYIDTSIVDVDKMNASYLENYSQAVNISKGFGDLKDSFDDLGEESGWWTKFTTIAAIPLLVISFPGIIFNIIATTISNLNDILIKIGIPSEITVLIGIAIIVWVVIKLINFIWAKEPA